MTTVMKLCVIASTHIHEFPSDLLFRGVGIHRVLIFKLAILIMCCNSQGTCVLDTWLLYFFPFFTVSKYRFPISYMASLSEIIILKFNLKDTFGVDLLEK
jgi:hypothetical protein